MDFFYDYWLIILGVYGFIFGMACSSIAKQKGKDEVSWWFCGFFLGVIGLLIIGFMPSEVEKRRSEPETLQSKKLEEELKRLGEMKKTSLISQQEFDELRAKVVADFSQS